MSTSWVIKASKKCNLRCLYCYEWPYLNDATRIELEVWRSILRAVREYHLLQVSRSPAHKSYIVWHGGEPLSLPPKYIRSVFELQDEILADIRHGVENVVQSNGFLLKDEHINIINEFDIGVGISFDVVSGARFSLGGRTTEDMVLKNMDLLRENRIPFGCICVVAAHTWQRMGEVYDFFGSNHIPFRALALRAGGSPEKVRYEIGAAQIEDAYADLFVAKLNHKVRVPVDPLDGYLQAVLLRMADLKRDVYDRRIEGERVFIVNTNGDVYSTNELYKRKLGNLRENAIVGILASGSYQKSLDEDDQVIGRQCTSCRYDKACDRFPVLQDTLSGDRFESCLAHRAMRRIEAILKAEGCTQDELHTFIREGLAVGEWSPAGSARMV